LLGDALTLDNDIDVGPRQTKLGSEGTVNVELVKGVLWRWGRQT